MGAENTIWHNGLWLSSDTKVFSALDRIRLGDGIYDTLLCVDGCMLHIDLHFKRLCAGLDVLGIQLDFDFERFVILTQEMIKRNHAEQGRFALNTVISRGESPRGLQIPDQSSPQIVMRLSPVPDSFDPLHGVIARNIRRNEGSPLSRIKSCNYGDNILALREAGKRGANEAVMLNNAGHVTCASAGNIFIVRDGAILTPPLTDGVMDGIIRQKLMLHYAVQEKSLTEDDLMRADEIFMANSIRGIMFFKTFEGRVYCENSLGIDKNFHITAD